MKTLIIIKFLSKNNCQTCIKHAYYERFKIKKFKEDLNRVENLTFDDKKNTLIRKDGIELEFLFEDGNYKYFKNPVLNKIIKYNYKFREYLKISYENITLQFENN